MAMIDPPMEDIFKMAGSRYALCTVISKRAKELLLERPEFFKENQKVKPIEFACKEFYDGKFNVVKTYRNQ